MKLKQKKSLLTGSEVMLVPVSFTRRCVVIARGWLRLLSGVAEKWILQIENVARLHRCARYSDTDLDVIALSAAATNCHLYHCNHQHLIYHNHIFGD